MLRTILVTFLSSLVQFGPVVSEKTLKMWKVSENNGQQTISDDNLLLGSMDQVRWAVTISGHLYTDLQSTHKSKFDNSKISYKEKTDPEKISTPYQQIKM